jgi:hypothetical protein
MVNVLTRLVIPVAVKTTPKSVPSIMVGVVSPLTMTVLFPLTSISAAQVEERTLVTRIHTALNKKMRWNPVEPIILFVCIQQGIRRFLAQDDPL